MQKRSRAQYSGPAAKKKRGGGGEKERKKKKLSCWKQVHLATHRQKRYRVRGMLTDTQTHRLWA